ncbi:CpsD/CapB family tyrosine-protein kinase [Butyrivibrio sp. NC3005]|uniref:CpsD/CapB family tyrosine-protein kinase n=1 Tax=Butyrivibrio sp. NC3005 TaxID=1280685 RepID=UPI0004035C7E|nr:CpsD/CapB family tyrosine-protein kinase [Butyrivibrio sp. NC3005]
MKDIELYQLHNSEFSDAIERFCVQMHHLHEAKGAKAFLFTGVDTNVGNTTVAINSAIFLAKSGNKVLFVDSDIRKSPENKHLTCPEEAGLTDYSTGNYNNIDEIVHPTNIRGLEIITSGMSSNATNIMKLGRESMKALIKKVKREYDYVVFDTASINIFSDALLLIPEMDYFMLVSSQNHSTKRQMFEARMHVNEYEEKYAGVVFNNVTKSLHF